MSVSVFDDPVLKSLFGDDRIAALFTARAEIDAMVSVESALAQAQVNTGVIDQEAAEAIINRLTYFSPDIPALEESTARDGVAVPELVKQLRTHVGEPHSEKIHHGATSQDIVDTALILRLKKIITIFNEQLVALIAALETLNADYGSNKLMGRTRMQAALPITVADRIAPWLLPLITHRQRLGQLAPRVLNVQYGGAVGTLHALGENGPETVAELAKILELFAPERPGHAMRDSIIELASWASLVTGTLGKMGQDIALMAQTGIGEISLSGTGTSSAMPHKQNPVKAEMLVTLARFNAVQVSGMHHAAIHEQERSGSAWALEWMILPQMLTATGGAMRTATDLVRSITEMGG